MSEVSGLIHKGLQEDLAFIKAESGMPIDKRFALLDALTAVWQLERDIEATPKHAPRSNDFRPTGSTKALRTNSRQRRVVIKPSLA